MVLQNGDKQLCPTNSRQRQQETWYSCSGFGEAGSVTIQGEWSVLSRVVAKRSADHPPSPWRPYHMAFKLLAKDIELLADTSQCFIHRNLLRKKIPARLFQLKLRFIHFSPTRCLTLFILAPPPLPPGVSSVVPLSRRLSSALCIFRIYLLWFPSARVSSCCVRSVYMQN